MSKLIVVMLLATLSAAVRAADLVVTPERAPSAGSVLITGRIASLPARYEVVVTDAYRGTELLRTLAPSAGRNGDVEIRLSYSAEPGAYAVWFEAPRGHRIAGPGYFFVPGITRYGAWWLFDGAPMCGALRTWGGMEGDAEQLVRPVYKGGIGFNVLTLELHEVMLGRWEADARRRDWPILERNGAYAFVVPGELGWEALTDAFALDKVQNEKGKASTEGNFWSARNRAAVLDYVRRMKESQFPSGAVSPAFLGLCAFENHMGFGPWYDYSPDAIAAYREEMRRRYGDVDAYNRAFGTAWASWDSLDAPRDALSTRHDWIPWTDFRFRTIAEFYAYLQPQLRRSLPGSYLFPIVGGMLATMQNDAGVTGDNAFEACDEREIARVVDLIGTEGWADYAAGHSDLLIAATDPTFSGTPSKPIWPDYYTYLSIGPDIPRSLILKRVDQIGHGATGTFMEHVGAVYEMGKKEPAFLDHLKEAAAVNRFLCEQTALFVGSRPAVDVALVTPADTLKYGRDKDTVRDADSTNAGIANALTRLHRDKRWLYQDTFTAATGARYPAVMATLGALTSDRFLAEAGKYAAAGGRLYLEGLGERNEFFEPAPGRAARLLAADVTAITPVDDEMTLEGPNSGSIPVKLHVRRLATVRSVTSGTRVLARFRDGSPAVLARAMGKGLIVWAPNWIVRDASYAYILKITQQREKPFNFWAAFDPAYCRYYARILDLLGVRGTEVDGPDTDAVRIGVLRTAAGSTLLSLVNYGDARNLTVRLPGAGAFLRDLRTGRAVPFTRHGDRIEFHYRAPANGWTFFALARNADALDAEAHRPLFHIREVEAPRQSQRAMAPRKLRNAHRLSEQS